MGYEVRKRIKKSGETVWHLYFRDVTADAKKDTYIPESAYLQHGFHPTMDIEDAKERARQLNSFKKLEKRNEKKKVRLLAQARERAELQSAHLPPNFVNEFENVFLKEHVGIGVTGFAKYQKMLHHWEKAKRIVVQLDIPLEDWSYRARAFYDRFRQDKVSYEYSRKIVRVLNLWGAFIARRTGQGFVEIKAPRGADKEMIADAWLDSGKASKESEPLSPQELENAKDKLKPAQYRWLYISVWLGLRTNEIEGIRKPKFYRLERDEQGIDILYVYQPKLVSIPRNERYKPIPLLYPEQKIALSYIQEGELKRPIVKTLQKYIKPGLNTYGGRKAFTDLMRSRGQSIEDISVWMGHQQISTTWAHYKNKRKATYKLPEGSNKHLKLAK